MAVSLSFQDGVLVVTMSGENAFREFVTAIRQAYADERFGTRTPVLIDARQSTAAPNAAEVHEGCRSLMMARPNGHAARWASVVRPEPLRFGIGRMVALTMESMGSETAVFTEVEAALTFLKARS